MTGKELRKKIKVVSIKLTPAEYGVMVAHAHACNYQSISSMIRAVLFADAPRPYLDSATLLSLETQRELAKPTNRKLPVLPKKPKSKRKRKGELF